jgi:TPR repeat protein
VKRDALAIAKDECATANPEKLRQAAKQCLAKDAGSCAMLCFCGSNPRLQGEACFMAGSKFHSDGALDVAGASFARACELHVAEGCFNAGLMSAKGMGLPRKEYGRAAGYYALGCESTSATACNNLGVLLSEGRDGVPRDDRRAVMVFDKACAKDEPMACGNLGNMYFRGDGVAKDEKKAYALYDRSCKAGSDRSCGRLGLAYVEGAGGFPRDPAHGLDLLRRACDKDVADSCAQLAELYEVGLGVPKDLSAARPLFQKACRSGMGKACVKLATSATLGATEEAVRWLAAGCKAPDRESCFKLGELLEKSGDVEKAIDAHAMACTEGAAPGCAHASALLGRQGKADESREFGERGCRISKDCGR